MKDKIWPYVLQNAIKFEGKINPKAVLGVVLRGNPELKSNVKEVLADIENLVEAIKGKKVSEMEKELLKIAPELLVEEKEVVKGPLKDLPNAEKGKVVLRIAPSPSGPLHIGHAYGTSLNYEYSKMYSGKLILRIEDTNPENIYPKAYELIERDAKWLAEGNVSEIVVQSSRLENYYSHAKKLVEIGKAYVCECDADKFRELKAEKKACPCRDSSDQKERYEKLFSSYSAGEAVLRLKTDIEHKNPAMRDFSLMRINEHTHPKTGTSFRVWPLMVFAVAIDDHELGVTHVLNGKDHADNSKKEALIMGFLGWKAPEYKHWGMINFTGFALSSSKTRIAIEQGEYESWEDIRLPFMPALRRRGYQPEAFRKYAMEIGLSLSDKTVSMEEFWKHVNAFNKDLIEPTANRYFFVQDPVTIEIEGAPVKIVEIALHPDFPKRGARKFSARNPFIISAADKLEEGKIHRLIDYCNFKVSKGKYTFVSEDYEDYKDSHEKGSIIHWLPASAKVIPVHIQMQDGSFEIGVGEENLKDVEEGAVVQLERQFFARLDSKEDKIVFWYLHK